MKISWGGFHPTDYKDNIVQKNKIAWVKSTHLDFTGCYLYIPVYLNRHLYNFSIKELFT